MIQSDMRFDFRQMGGITLQLDLLVQNDVEQVGWDNRRLGFGCVDLRGTHGVDDTSRKPGQLLGIDLTPVRVVARRLLDGERVAGQGLEHLVILRADCDDVGLDDLVAGAERVLPRARLDGLAVVDSPLSVYAELVVVSGSKRFLWMKKKIF